MAICLCRCTWFVCSFAFTLSLFIFLTQTHRNLTQCIRYSGGEAIGGTWEGDGAEDGARGWRTSAGLHSGVQVQPARPGSGPLYSTDHGWQWQLSSQGSERIAIGRSAQRAVRVQNERHARGDAVWSAHSPQLTTAKPAGGRAAATRHMPEDASSHARQPLSRPRRVLVFHHPSRTYVVRAPFIIISLKV